VHAGLCTVVAMLELPSAAGLRANCATIGTYHLDARKMGKGAAPHRMRIGGIGTWNILKRRFTPSGALCRLNYRVKPPGLAMVRSGVSHRMALATLLTCIVCLKYIQPAIYSKKAAGHMVSRVLPALRKTRW
jgi:hypothetical protein